MCRALLGLGCVGKAQLGAFDELPIELNKKPPTIQCLRHLRGFSTAAEKVDDQIPDFAQEPNNATRGCRDGAGVSLCLPSGVTDQPSLTR